jgi:glycosyltransferase involved in cell wall biosynthesis
MPTKKIVFILATLRGGGAERVSVNYIRQLDSRQYVITLVTFESSPDLLSVIPSNVKIIDLSTVTVQRSFLPLLKLLRRIKPDIIFTTHYWVAVLVMIIRIVLPKCYHIARMQNTPSLEKKYAAYNSLYAKLFSAGFKSANIVIAQTEDMKTDAVKIFRLNSNRIVVQYNPIDGGYINEMLKNAQSPFPENSIAAIASGRLSFQKAFDVLIKAVPRVIEKYPAFVLYILGKDSGEGEKLAKLVYDLKLEAHVSFQGFVENPYPYYKYCNLFILSSRYEGFPNVLIENYYLNTPIVSTPCVPVIEKLVSDGQNGFLCKIDDPYSLSDAIIKTLAIKRQNLSNPPYQGGNIQDLIELIG